MIIVECSNNLPEDETYNDDGTVVVVRRSPFTGRTHSAAVRATRGQFLPWTNGKLLLQHAFPKLTADEREFIKTGITPQEWKDAFGE